MKREQDPLIAEALVEGCGQAEAARRAGVSERTVRRRLKDPAFQILLRDRRNELLKRTADRFMSLHDRALDAVEAGLGDSCGDTRLRAARMVFDIGSRYRDRVELEARLEEVEKRQHPDVEPQS